MKLCPLFSLVFKNPVECKDKTCAWWDCMEKQCCVKSWLIIERKGVDAMIDSVTFDKLQLKQLGIKK